MHNIQHSLFRRYESMESNIVFCATEPNHKPILPYDETENDAYVGMLSRITRGKRGFLHLIHSFIYSWPLGFVLAAARTRVSRKSISCSSITTVNKHVKHNNRNSNNMNDAHEPHGIIYFLFLRHFPTVMDEDPKGFVFSRVR